MSKLGPHVQFRPNLTEAGWKWCETAPIVKAMDDPEPLRLAKPGVITIFRAYIEYQDSISPRRFLNTNIFRLRGFHPTYIESQNEWRSKGSELLDRLPWEKEFVKLAHDAGYKVAGFCQPWGTPEQQDWLTLRDANFCGVDAMALHEYWGSQGFSGWAALRYRKVHSWLNGHHPPFIITECGRDAVEGCEGQPGWKLQGVSAEDYARELLDYAAETDKDNYVLGITPFTIAPSEEKWRHFTIEDVIPYLTAQQGVDTMPEWKLAFVDYARLHPEVGTPTTTLMYDSHGNAWQYSDQGLLFSHKADGWKIYWFPRPK